MEYMRLKSKHKQNTKLLKVSKVRVSIIKELELTKKKGQNGGCGETETLTQNGKILGACPI